MTLKAPSSATARNSSVELLRIAAMLFIVLSHACMFTIQQPGLIERTFNRLAIHWGTLGNLGVDIFVLITGYFLCGRGLRLRSVCRSLSQVWFYSIAIFLVCRLGLGVEYTARQMLTVFLPTLFQEYWFFTAYFVLLLLSPFLNTFLSAASRDHLRAALGAMAALWVVIPTFTGQDLYAGEVPHFVLLYLAGAYVRRFPRGLMARRWVRWGLTLGSLGLLMLSTVVVDALIPRFPALAWQTGFFYYRNSLLVVGASVGLFLMAVYARPFTSPLVNALGGCTFGVYLIHDNPVVRDLLWQRLSNAEYAESPVLVLRLLGQTAAVFGVCTAVEFLRQKTIARPMEEGLYRLLSAAGKLRRPGRKK